MPKVSVIIPVFRKSKYLQKILKELERASIDKEIIVTIDEPSKEMKKIAREFKNIRFIFNKKRLGKVEALNRAAKLAKGEHIVFLDSDIELSENFLDTLYKKIKNCDFADIKKVVIKDSLLARMTYYEYAGFNIGTWLVAKFVGRSPAVNGSAFAIRRSLFNALSGFRKTVSEDIDIATRAFLRKASFRYVKEAYVMNHVHSSWKKWFIQRKRWTTGAALWLKDWYKPMLKEFLSKPQAYLPALIFLFPSLLIFMANMLVPNSIFVKLISLISVFLAPKFGIFIPIFVFSQYWIAIFKAAMLSLASFLLFAIIFCFLSKKLEFTFNFFEFFLYYFVYAPIFLAILFAALVKVLIFGKMLKISDWKI